MNRHNLSILAAVLAGLVLVLFVLQAGDDDMSAGGELLFPHLKEQINDITAVTITHNRDDEPTTVRREADGWVVASRGGYAADVGKLRELLLSLADARRVEQKTSNADLYDRLGVRDPSTEGSKGVLLELQGADTDYKLIVGNTAQGGYRYVRIAADPQSWLIDKNPNVPDTPGAWLEKNIVDIKAAAVRSVTIHHPDGEEIRVSKDSADAADFDVLNIPDGRELSYATVANSIAGALNALALEDVRRSGEPAADAVTTTFDTFDDVQIVVSTVHEDDAYWISVEAGTIGPQSEEEGADDTGDDADEVATADADDSGEATESIASINARVAGWEYRIPEYKANQLSRRWDDILKARSD